VRVSPSLSAAVTPLEEETPGRHDTPSGLPFASRVAVRLPVAGLVLLAAFVNFLFIGRQNYEADEVYRVRVAHLSRSGLVGAERRAARAWWGCAVVSCLAVGGHFVALLVVLAHLVSLVFLPGRTYCRRAVLGALAAIGAVLSTVAVALMGSTVELFWVGRP